MNVRTIAVVVVACSVLTSAQQQEDPRQTLPQLARRFAPQPVYQSRIADLVLESLDTVLPRADVIVHGKVDRATTYLSADQRDLYTDYLIRPLRIIRQPITPPITRPGQTSTAPPIVVTRWGGQMTIEGVQVTQEDANVNPFRVGDEVVLLLAYNKAEAKYRLSSARLVDGLDRQRERWGASRLAGSSSSGLQLWTLRGAVAGLFRSGCLVRSSTCSRS